MENSASSDAIVREKIARLPPDVSEVVHLEKLKSAKEGAELMEKVIIFSFFMTAFTKSRLQPRNSKFKITSSSKNPALMVSKGHIQRGMIHFTQFSTNSLLRIRTLICYNLQ